LRGVATSGAAAFAASSGTSAGGATGFGGAAAWPRPGTLITCPAASLLGLLISLYRARMWNLKRSPRYCCAIFDSESSRCTV